MEKLSKVEFVKCLQASRTKLVACSFFPILFPRTNKLTDEQICECIDRWASDFDRYTPFLDTLPARNVTYATSSRVIFDNDSELDFNQAGKNRFFRADKENLTLYIHKFTYYDNFDEKEYNSYQIYMKI